MGSFCDVVAAPVKDAKKVADANGNYAKWKSAGLKGLSHVNFAVLQAQLTGVRAVDAFEDYVFLETGASVMVQRIPDALVAALAKLPPKELPKAAKAWAASEELEGYALNDVQGFLDELVALAQKAGKAPLRLCVSGF